MKTILMLIVFTMTTPAQHKAETAPWLVDPAYVQNSVYTLNVGRNPYEAFLRSLAGLAEKLKSSDAKIRPNAPITLPAVQQYSFGRVNITYLKGSNTESSKKSDSLDYQSTVTISIKVQFSENTKDCFIAIGGEAVDHANDETFGPATYNSNTHIQQTLSYKFTNMTFGDLLNELEREGVKIYSKTEYDVVYALATYPLSKVKK